MGGISILAQLQRFTQSPTVAKVPRTGVRARGAGPGNFSAEVHCIYAIQGGAVRYMALPGNRRSSAGLYRYAVKQW